MSDEKLVSLGENEQEIEIDLEEGTSEAKAAPEPVELPKQEESKTPPKEDELEQYSDSVKKRIEKLTFKYREAERREQAALEFAKSLKNELETVRQKSQQLDTSLLNEATNRIKTQEQLINDRLRVAIDRGDVDGQVSAQRELTNLAVENERLRLAQVRREYEVEQQRRAAVQPTPQQQAPAVPDRKATDWAEKNQWFGQDEPMTFTAFSIHKNLVELEGFDPTSDEYYSELDKRIRREFPHKFTPSETKQKPSPMVASANGSQRAENRKQIKLTPSQVAIAKRLGVSLKDYARQLQRLNG